ncbi:MAG: LacI family DNA-binding transcriptional regulator [Oscillospiraceae bacterium]|nr:LacI family DNA-binding transcriptional regulator [Oscillospiraceae bacterium]
MATLKDVAERAGVTVATVSRMLNGRIPVSDKTSARIQQAMAELHYHPNELARSLAKRSSSFIGLIVPSAKNYFFASVIDSIEHHSAAQGCKLLLCVSNLDTQKEKEYFDMLISNKVMGIILASHTQDLAHMIGLGAPLLTIDRVLSPGIPSACADNYNGGRIAAEHLIARGSKRLVYISGSASFDMDANKRYLGLRDACLAHGLEKPGSVDALEDQFISMEYEDTVDKVFRRYPKLDGIVASNDVIAAAVIRYAHRNGIDIPGQVKVVGYDDSSFAVHCTPKLTTIHQPIDEIARYAVQCILRAAAGEMIPTSAVFPVTLVQRETT